jgi:hypothetical protein
MNLLAAAAAVLYLMLHSKSGCLTFLQHALLLIQDRDTADDLAAAVPERCSADAGDMGPADVAPAIEPVRVAQQHAPGAMASGAAAQAADAE